jgi:hypothetical protein
LRQLPVKVQHEDIQYKTLPKQGLVLKSTDTGSVKYKFYGYDDSSDQDHTDKNIKKNCIILVVMLLVGIHKNSFLRDSQLCEDLSPWE